MLYLVIIFQVLHRRITPMKPKSRHQVADFLSDHNCRRVRVTPRNIGHDGGVYHPQSLHPMNLEFRVHHCIGVTLRSHFARTDKVVNRASVMTGNASPVLVAVELMLLTRR